MTTSSGIIQDEMFRLELLDWQGTPAVKKSAKPTTAETRAVRMKNDVYGMRFFMGLANDNPSLGLYIPQVYESGEGFYIREFVSDPPVTTEAMSAAEAAPRLGKLAKFLADVDRIEPFGEVRFVGSSNYQKLHESIGRWADENAADNLITTTQANRLKEISDPLGKYISPRIAHGDMSPYKHAYLRPDGKIALIDFENFTPEAARYFDLAWSYTRLYSFAKATDIPKRFLASFLDHAAAAPNQTQQLMAVLIQRTLAMQKDADVDLAGKGIDYRDRAKELLELVLQNKLELLT
jgi:hypothetical protein